MTAGLSQEERQWIVVGMAWVALQRWLCGAEDADQARQWFNDRLELHFGAAQGRMCITEDLERLSGEMKWLLTRGPDAPPAMDPRPFARMPEFGSVGRF